MSIPSYLSHYTAKEALDDWLDDSSFLALNLAASYVGHKRLAWDLIQVCFSIFHSNRYYLSSDEFTVLGDLLITNNSRTVDIVKQNYFYYLYLSVYGVYGHLPTSAMYVEVLQNAMEAAAENIYLTRSISRLMHHILTFLIRPCRFSFETND